MQEKETEISQEARFSRLDQKSKAQLRHLSRSVLLEEVEDHYLMRMTVFVIFGAVTIFLIWASMTSVNEVARAGGEVRPSGYIQQIQHLAGGMVESILVSEGEVVQKGQLLITIKGPDIKSDYEALMRNQTKLEAEIKSLKAFSLKEIIQPILTEQGRTPEIGFENVTKTLLSALAKERSRLQERATMTNSQIKAVSQKYQFALQNQILSEKEVQLMDDMHAHGEVTEINALQVQKSLNTAKAIVSSLGAERQTLEQQKNRLEQQLTTLRQRYQEQALTQIVELEERYTLNQQRLDKMYKKKQQLNITSPIAGVVKGLQVTSIGGVVNPGETLMEIMPVSEKMIVEAKISPRDIGHVNIGQNVHVKVGTYDFSRYGAVEGTLSFISAGTFADGNGGRFYRGRIELEKNYVGQQHEKNKLLPGMTVVADVITGQKTILSYMFKPIYISMSRAFTER